MILIMIIKASLQRFCWLLVVGFQNRKMLDPEYDDTSESKRKKSYSRREILEKLEECENDVKRAVGEIVADISPFDVADSNVEDFEEKVEKLDKVSKNLAAKIYKLKSAVKAKKFRRNEELLDEKFFSSSQYSVLQSQDPEDLSQTLSEASLHEETGRPDTYRLAFSKLCFK